MADEDDHESVEEEEQDEIPPFLAVKDDATLQKLLASPQKIVAIAFLIDGHPQCESVKEWLEALGDESSYAPNVQFVVIDPDTLPAIARRCKLSAVPGFGFFWRRNPYRVYSGTNQDKFMFALTKMIELKNKELEDAKNKNEPIPMMCCAPGDKVELMKGNRRMTTAVLSVNWSHVPSESPWVIQIVAGCLGQDGRLISNEEMVHLGNPANPSGSISIKPPANKTTPDGKEIPGLMNSSVEFTLNKLDQGISKIAIVVFLQPSKTATPMYLPQLFNFNVTLHNKDSEQKMPFQYDVDLVNGTIPATYNGVLAGHIVSNPQPGGNKWQFECLGLPVLVPDAITVGDILKSSQPTAVWRGYMDPTETTILTPPAKVHLQRGRPLLNSPVFECGWDCMGNQLQKGRLAVLCACDENINNIPKDKQHVFWHDGNKTNSNGSISLTPNETNKTVSLALKFAGLPANVSHIIIVAVANDEDTLIGSGWVTMNEKEGGPGIAKVIRDTYNKEVVEWSQQQQQIVAQWRTQQATLQAQIAKTKDKEKEANLQAQLAVLPQLVPLKPLPPSGRPLPLGALVRCKRENGPTWEYWAEPKVDYSALNSLVRTLV
eukprot:TRINITY_DN68561_c0_g1_i1.p1 TRINITY_DN68561_c0_g1~~TRINITY_DN68561_c0_g1_i1.p1  ORF type:complete len:603 (+),score=70.00 TRINITY_DN68561_c0_g1_i1:96-1904(+)